MIRPWNETVIKAYKTRNKGEIKIKCKNKVKVEGKWEERVEWLYCDEKFFIEQSEFVKKLLYNDGKMIETRTREWDLSEYSEGSVQEFIGILCSVNEKRLESIKEEHFADILGITLKFGFDKLAKGFVDLLKREKNWKLGFCCNVCYVLDLHKDVSNVVELKTIAENYLIKNWFIISKKNRNGRYVKDLNLLITMRGGLVDLGKVIAESSTIVSRVKIIKYYGRDVCESDLEIARNYSTMRCKCFILKKGKTALFKDMKELFDNQLNFD